MKNLEGWRTMLAGLGILIGPTALEYLAGVDWSALLGSKGAFAVSALLMFAMRMVSNGPVGWKKG